ncbi:MAG: ROK family protein [Pseudomonadota bacterium]
MRLGVDLGGTKIEAATLEGDRVTARERVPTPRDDYGAIIQTIADLADRLAPPGLPLGIGIPGSLSPATGLVRNANSTALNGKPFDRDLSAALSRPVRLANDANCFALAEARMGAGQGVETVFGVILGTGVGGGVVVHGKLLTGRNAIAGEWGHTPLADSAPAPRCWCGRYGCVEAWCSGPALAADHLRVTGADMTAEMIAAVAQAGDLDARETLERHVNRLGRAMAPVVNILDPDIIVLGGGLSNMAHLYDELPSAMRPHIFSDCVETQIVRHRLGDSAGVIGAAWLWP